MSLAIWDHKVSPATRYKWTHLSLTPARLAGTRFAYPGWMEGSVDQLPLNSRAPIIFNRPELFILSLIQSQFRFFACTPHLVPSISFSSLYLVRLDEQFLWVLWLLSKYFFSGKDVSAPSRKIWPIRLCTALRYSYLKWHFLSVLWRRWFSIRNGIWPVKYMLPQSPTVFPWEHWITWINCRKKSSKRNIESSRNHNVEYPQLSFSAIIVQQCYMYS